MSPRRSIAIGLLAALALAAPAASRAGDDRPISGEFGILLGGAWTSANYYPAGGGPEVSTLVGLRMASRFNPRWNWFADGVYTQPGYPGGSDDVKLYEVRTGFERLFPMGSGSTNFFIAGALGAGEASYPPGLGNFGRGLLSLGFGLAGANGGLRAELRGESWVGNGGVNGDDLLNGQLVFGYSFGFHASGPQDSDGDGVTDDKDRCPGTPHGATVDAYGCPQDSDGDGVYDGIDECPDTPRGALVDARGCPLDSDGDGVYDGIDKCPGTPPGTAVDKDGCPLHAGRPLFEPGKEKLVLEGVNFAFNSDELTPESHETLDNVAASLQDWSEVRVRVEGYTDNIGDAQYNLGLSDRRAKAVRDYLISKGIDASRLEWKGFGEADPVASNDTPEGRAKNRRVELERLH
jgi:OOP family OmpA-OmpF porin